MGHFIFFIEIRHGMCHVFMSCFSLSCGTFHFLPRYVPWKLERFNFWSWFAMSSATFHFLHCYYPWNLGHFIFSSRLALSCATLLSRDFLCHVARFIFSLIISHWILGRFIFWSSFNMSSVTFHYLHYYFPLKLGHFNILGEIRPVMYHAFLS